MQIFKKNPPVPLKIGHASSPAAAAAADGENLQNRESSFQILAQLT